VENSSKRTLLSFPQGEPRPLELRTLKITIAYDGTNYVGWQRQAAGVSIQQLMEEACAPLAGGVPLAVAGAGRTDAGVHALGQVASLRLHTALPPDTLQRAINFRLPADVRVLAVEDAPAAFHARFAATGKCYRYRIAVAPVLPPFDRWFVHHAPEARDLDAMRRAAAGLIGRHDFASFHSADGDATDTTRTVRRLDVCPRSGEVALEIEGDGFLRHMVRAIAGTLIEVAAGRRSADAMSGILAARDRRAAGRTAPARGLTLVSVSYDPARGEELE
jgi:tRNA pseudouridine38-40 synthase